MKNARLTQPTARPEDRFMRPIIAFWSGGKDSALALDRLRRDGAWDVVALVTTINPTFGRVSMHGVREALIEAQAAAIGIPLHKMYVGDSSEAYVAGLRETLAAFKARDVSDVAFGDIFLADLRQWRESHLSALGLQGVFPLWGAAPRALLDEFMALGFKALTCCVNDAHLTRAHVGRDLDRSFLDALPPGVDPCGENGEYHSFVYDGPIFERPVVFRPGEIVYRPLGGTPDADAGPSIGVPATSTPGTTKGFWFIDLVP
jgi:uncharacterized protein (TIGR00290 family)